MKGWRKRRVLLLAVGAALLAGAALAMIYQRVDARAKEDRVRRADTIIVLGSAVWPHERPSPSLNARIQHAVALYQAGYATHLILCGGVGAYPPSEAEVMRRVATQAGVPDAALVLEERSHSTEENLANAKRLMDARGWRSAVIVSDPFHLYRAELLAHALGIEAYGSGASTSPTYTHAYLRVQYTARESIALVWYYVTRLVGEPLWLYALLKGRI